MKVIKILFAATFGVTALALSPIGSKLMVPNAFAQVATAKMIVDRAKSDKLVGESLKGYLEFVTPNVSAEIRAAVNEINIIRKSLYTAKARETKVSISDIAGLTGEKLVAKAKSGEMVKLADNQWHQK